MNMASGYGMHIESKFKIKGLTVKFYQFSVCTECTVIAINNVPDLTTSTQRAVQEFNAGIL